MDKSSLGNRMKRYESVSKNYLMRKQPAIIRLDGKAFHTFTRGFVKPFDLVLNYTMQGTMKYLCENIQGCVLGYTRSDEITLVLCDYQKIDTDAWFDYNVQKMVSVAASMATMKFNQIFAKEAQEFYIANDECESDETREKLESYEDVLERAARKGAVFDARVFTVPIEGVNNCLLWRQQDATRNSIQALAQSLYQHKEIQGINVKALQDKMFTEKGINWDDLPTEQKRGSCCIKNDDGNWIIDNDIPIFSQNPNYVNSKITFE